MLNDLFYIKEEVSGGIINGSHLRLDLLLRPNEKAKQMGIDVEAIGIEIKDPQSKESAKKLLDCVMQAYTYSFCEFDGVRLAFILIYPDIENSSTMIGVINTNVYLWKNQLNARKTYY
ncbi:hypothetical protein [Acinetobacter modestus]|uniref:hypothetical protein n=1 Tax=Acinetobacter modestus TaxID=1776740 RepID=UPI00320B5A70